MALAAFAAVFADGTWPSVLSLMSAPVSELLRTSTLLSVLFRTSPLRRLLFRTSFDLTELFLMSPESTLFVPRQRDRAPRESCQQRDERDCHGR